MDGIACFPIEMSSATQNWLKMPDGLMTVNYFVKYCESLVCASDVWWF